MYVPTVQLIKEAKIRIFFQVVRSSPKMSIFLEDLAERSIKRVKKLLSVPRPAGQEP
jgi:hypothetical protein